MKHTFTSLWLFVLAMLFVGQSIAQDRSYPFSWDNATVYFLLNDRFNNGNPANDYSYGRSKNSPNGELDFQGGDLKGIQQKIEDGYFDALGVNSIWITAPYEQMHGPIGSENSWAFAGYWTKDWSQMDANMGSEADLRNLIDAAHNHGIRIVMDIVLNHTGYPTASDNAWPSSWVRNDCEGGDTDRYCPLAGLPDIRTNITSGNVDLPQWLLDKWQAAGVRDKELAELNTFFARTGFPRVPRYYIMKWLTDWVREYGIDGYRVDTAKHLEVEAWKELKNEAVAALREWKNANPNKKVDNKDFWMTGEVFGQSIYSGKNYYFDNGFDNVINFGFKSDLTNKSQEEIFSYYANAVNNTSGFNILSYIASHDVAPYDRSNLYYAGTTLMLAPGGVQIYYGDESGRDFFAPQTYGDAGYRKFMNWSEIANNQNTKNLLSHWQKLGRFRREHIAVGAGSHEKLNDTPYIFRRSYSNGSTNDKVLVAMNVLENDAPYLLNVYGTFADGVLLKDYFSGATATVNNGQASFQTSNGMLLVGEPFNHTAVVNLDITPASGRYSSTVEVQMLASSSTNTTIHYTTDGSEPTEASPTWNNSTSFGANLASVTIKAIAIDTEGNKSGIITRNFTFGELQDFDLHFKNTSNWNQVKVYLYDKNSGEALPGWNWPGVNMVQEGSSPWYTYTVNETVEVGIVFNDGIALQTDDLFRTSTSWYDGTWHNSCTGDCPTAPKPTLSTNIAGGNYTNTATVLLSATEGGKIYYTTDGSTPNQNSSVYTGALTFTSTTQLRALAYNTEGASNEINETYIITTEEPFQLHYKNSNNWQEVYVYLFDKNSNVAIDGWTWPGKAMTQEGTSPWYTFNVEEGVEIGIVFNNKEGLKTDDLFRQATGWYDSTWHNTCSGDCPTTIQLPVLSVSPAGTSFQNSITITLSATESGSIFYTTDGSTPTTNSTAYTEPVKLIATGTLQAIAYNTAGASNLIQEAYVLEETEEVPVVSISPASGSFMGKIDVTISATNNGIIHYTTDGSIPNKLSQSYTGAFELTASATVKAIAYNTHGTSTITNAALNITPIVTPTNDKFTWDNALVYFVMTDRFYNGDPTNDNAYNRGLDGNLQPYETEPYASSDAGMFHGGDILGLTQKLEEGYFERIGVNAIWITAPYEQIHGWVGGGPDGDFVHYPYHGYYTLDWSEMDNAMGTAAQFQEFVDLAHSKGIRIVMDVVLNHVGYTNFADGEQFGYGCWNDDWKSWRPSSGTGWHDYHADVVDYTCNNWGNYWGDEWVRHPDLTGYDACSPGGGIANCVGFLPDIKTETTTATNLPPILVEKWTQEGTLAQKQAEIDAWFTKTGLVKTPANYIIFWITQWIEKYGVDGLRIDTAKHVELEIWKRLKEQGNASLAEWKTKNPEKALDQQELWMTAEVWGHGPNKSEYHDYGFNSVINFGLKTDNRLSRDAALMESLFADYASNVNTNPDFNILSYVSSHDVTPLFPREQLKVIAPAFVLLPGGVQIFYGDEAARPEGTYADEEQNTRSDFDWNNYDNETLDVFSRLGRFRRAHPAIGAGSHTKLSDSPYLFMRDYENAALKQVDRVAIAIGANGTTTFDVSTVFPEGEIIVDAYTGTEYTVSDGNVTVTPHTEGIVLLEFKNAPAYQIKPIVSIEPKGTYSENPIEITIATSDEEQRNFTTYYTTNDDNTIENLSAWNVYSGTFTLTESCTLRVIAETEDGVRSRLATERYAIGAIQPFLVHVWSPNGVPNIYTWAAKPEGVVADMVWPGKAMQTEGNEGWYVYAIPALSSNIIFTIDGVQTDNLNRDKEGWFKNGKWYNTCPSNCPGAQVPLVSVNPSSKNFSDGSGSVNITAVGADAIFYTTDGSTPSQASTQYTGSFIVSGTETETIIVKAIAFNQAGISEVVSVSYTFEHIAGFTVYFWSPSCVPNVHIWNALPEESLTNTTWPGLEMTDEGGSGWYSYYIPSNSANVIFNNCNGQTADLTRSSDGWYRDQSWSGTCNQDCPTDKKSLTLNSSETSKKEASYRIFPNPTADVLFINTSATKKSTRVAITTLTGAVVWQKQLETTTNKLNLDHLPKGVYMLQLSLNGNVYTEKIILK